MERIPTRKSGEILQMYSLLKTCLLGPRVRAGLRRSLLADQIRRKGLESGIVESCQNKVLSLCQEWGRWGAFQFTPGEHCSCQWKEAWEAAL